MSRYSAPDTGAAMHEVEVQVRPATARDQGRIRALLDQSHRRYNGFGNEDLPALLQHPAHAFIVADANGALWGLACAMVRTRPPAPGEAKEIVWGYLRGLAIINGWRAEVGVWALIEGLRQRLRSWKANYLVAYVTQAWMEASLREVGLQAVEQIVTYERIYEAIPPLRPFPQGRIRPAQAPDVSSLAALDTAAFSSLWRLASGELIEMLVTSAHFMVAEQEGRIVGYACSDVQHGVGQIYRLAVHPAHQGQGIGRLLLADALAYCQSVGAFTVTINTQQSNHASDHLYRRFGFRPVPPRVPVMLGDV